MSSLKELWKSVHSISIYDIAELSKSVSCADYFGKFFF